MKETHTIKKYEDLIWDKETSSLFGIKKSFEFPQLDSLSKVGYKTKVIAFPKHHKIEPHSHSEGRVYKIILNQEGCLKYGIDVGKEQYLRFGEIAWVEKGISYDSIAEENTMLLIIQPKESVMLF